MAEIKFYANVGGNPTLIDHTQNSGIGFYGSSFGVSVPIGQTQGTTYVTNANGTAQGIALNNTKYANNLNRTQNPGKVLTGDTGSAPLDLNKLPNHLCPLNIRFTHSEAVRVQNCKLRIFDRNDINNHASGVITYVYEARHPLQSQTAERLAHIAPGRNDSWVVFDPALSMADMPFTNSPGISGINTSAEDTSLTAYYAANGITNPSNFRMGSIHTSLRHDWYVALSSEPVTIGSKTQYGLYFSVEYL